MQHWIVDSQLLNKYATVTSLLVALIVRCLLTVVTLDWCKTKETYMYVAWKFSSRFLVINTQIFYS